MLKILSGYQADAREYLTESTVWEEIGERAPWRPGRNAMYEKIRPLDIP
jgi:hypothetical protein